MEEKNAAGNMQAISAYDGDCYVTREEYDWFMFYAPHIHGAPVYWRGANPSVGNIYVWGEKDRMVSASGARRITAALPRTRVELIRDCGHCPQIEAVDRVVDLLLQFPAELSRAA